MLIWLTFTCIFEEILKDHYVSGTLLIKSWTKWTKVPIVVVQSLSHVWFCDPVDCSMPGFPILQSLLEFAQTHVHWVSDAIQSSHLRSPTSPVLSLSQHQSLPMSQLFTSGGQSIGASTSASILPVNIQGWFPLGFTGLISLQSRGLSRVFSSNALPKHQFFGTHPSLCSSSHISTWLLEKS